MVSGNDWLSPLVAAILSGRALVPALPVSSCVSVTSREHSRHVLIDGAHAPVYRANLIHWAVKVPAGQSVVEFRFVPPEFCLRTAHPDIAASAGRACGAPRGAEGRLVYRASSNSGR